ncbi:ABC transporter substrate-binding protein [Shewanella sp. WXL01]|nr:ABC transporter substrate-binding protein [Shewanella sp. WXL01]
MLKLFKPWLFFISSAGLMLTSGCSEPQLPTGIVYCSEGNPESFNPQLVTSGTTIDATSHQIYNRLIGYSATTKEFESELATRWQVSDDGLSYRFWLRENVTFHDNNHFSPSRYFNADDVLFSFERVINYNHPFHDVSRTGYPYFQSINLSGLVSRIEKVNDFEVVFHLNRSDASFLFNLATDFAVILSAEYGQYLLDNQRAEELDFFAIGTGPYKLHQYVKNDHIRFKPHVSFWGEKVAAEQLVYDITTNSTARLTKLITGDCNVSALPKPAELAVLKQQQDIRVDSSPGLNVAFWAFNTQKPPFDDLRVRQALSHAIDKQKILDLVYNNTAVEATGLLPPASWAYSKIYEPNEYNPQKAKALLDEANVKQLNIDIWAMPVARAYNPNAVKMAELMQEDLAQIGVSTNIISYDWSVFTQKLSEANYDSVLIGWNADNNDPDNFFSPVLSCSALRSNNNYSRWCDNGFDHLLSLASSLTKQPDRKVYFQSAEAIIADRVPIVPIAHAQKMVLHNKSITNLQIRPYGGISFANASQDIVEEQQ